MQRVAVTGASGFIGSHIVRQLLASNASYVVRAVVRDHTNKAKVAPLVRLAAGLNAGHRLELVSADMTVPGDLERAFEAQDAVIHTAAAVKLSAKDPRASIVDPIMSGTKLFISAVESTPSLKSVVFTSSIAAIHCFHRSDSQTSTERDWNSWSTVEKGDPYSYAKTESERLIHQAAADARPDVKFSIINPGVVLGECLTKAHTKASPLFVRQILYGNEQPDILVTVVDVRDVADAHIKALTHKSSERCPRFILTGDAETHRLRLSQLQQRIQYLFPELSVPAKFVPGWKLFLARFFVTPFERELATRGSGRFSNQKVKEELLGELRPLEDTLAATVRSMIDSGWVPAARKQQAKL